MTDNRTAPPVNAAAPAAPRPAVAAVAEGMAPAPPAYYAAAAFPQPMPQAPNKPKTTLADAVFALGMLLAGLLFWEWDVIGGGYLREGFGTSVFFLALIAATWLYLRLRGIRQNRRSLVLLAVCCLGALPYGLYGGRDINLLLFWGEMLACLLWVAYSCQTILKQRLSGLIIFDALRQGLFVPFRYFGWLFIAIGRLFAKGSRRQGWGVAWRILLGLLIAAPLLAIVVFLLSRADDGFDELVRHLTSWIQLSFFDSLFEYLLELILGLPIAAYIFGAVFGNVRRRLLAAEQVERRLAGLRAVSSLVVLVPLLCLAAIYLLFFVAMGGYLFSALQGELPESYTYAQYARRGFFELCGVASINLALLGFVCLFARRQAERLPLAVRVLTAAISLLTCLLVVTAASKMYLYVGAYGLTQLRLYTSWFMLLLLLVFLLIAVWHLKPFNLARPIVLVFTTLTLALALTNTNGLIANYNTERYLSGRSQTVDVDTLYSLGVAGTAALQKLSEQAPSIKVRNDAANALKWREEDIANQKDIGNPLPWHNQNLLMLLNG